MKRAIHELGQHAIDRRTSLGRALGQWRADLVRDLGGLDAISMQEETVIELAIKTKLILDSVDTWILAQPNLVHGRKRALLPVVLQRQQLADALARYMSLLGLKRRQVPVPSIEAYLSSEQGSHTDGAGAKPPPGLTTR